MSTKQARFARVGVGYIRVSRKGKRGGDNYVTEDMQRATIEAYAKAKGIRIVAWFTDVNRSGKNTNREGLQEALRMIDDGEADTLIVAKLSRFARNVKDARNMLARIEAEPHRGSLIACDIDVDTTTAVGRLLRDILQAVAEFEVELAADNWTEIVANAVADGVYPRKAPPGYRKDKRRRLRRDPKVAKLVTAAFIGRGGGASWAELLADWKAAGGPPISRQGLNTILSNRTYLGSATFGGTTLTFDALVSPEQYEDAQAAKAPRAWRSRNGSLLAGSIFCSSCGGALTSSGHEGNGRKPSYKCKPSRKDGTCSAKMSITQQWADLVVEEAILAWAADYEYEGTANGESGMIAAQRKAEAADAELAAYVETASAIDRVKFKLGLDKRQAVLDEANAEVLKLKGERRVEHRRVRLGSLWPELTTEERRRIVAEVVERIEVHPDTSAQKLGGHAPDEARLAAARGRLRIVFRRDAA